MQHKIDYLSFTYHSEKIANAASWRLMQTLVDELPAHVEMTAVWKHAPKRVGFDLGMNINDHTFIWCNHTGLILCEHTGQACTNLESDGAMDQVIHHYADNLTRVDVATDILSPISPSAFVGRSGQTATSAKGYQQSKSGETCYVGSRKSDRTCKVYRYHKPHPRADWLRIEYTYRSEQAKIVGNMLKGESVENVALKSATRYKWKHPVWKLLKSPKKGEIEAWRPERRQGKTVTWIYSQVIPSIARLVKQNVIDLEEIITAIREACKERGNE